ncbi:uncharacterized protein LOC144864589 [Branchiostoma floridae x Branchiostoma japonicum]
MEKTADSKRTTSGSPNQADASSSGPDTDKTEGRGSDLWASGKMGKMGRITRKKGKRITEELKHRFREYETEDQSPMETANREDEPSEKPTKTSDVQKEPSAPPTEMSDRKDEPSDEPTTASDEPRKDKLGDVSGTEKETMEDREEKISDVQGVPDRDDETSEKMETETADRKGTTSGSPNQADASSSGPDTDKTDGRGPDLWASGKMGKMGRITRKKGKRITEELKHRFKEYETEDQSPMETSNREDEPSEKPTKTSDNTSYMAEGAIETRKTPEKDMESSDAEDMQRETAENPMETSDKEQKTSEKPREALDIQNRALEKQETTGKTEEKLDELDATSHRERERGEEKERSDREKETSHKQKETLDNQEKMSHSREEETSEEQRNILDKVDETSGEQEETSDPEEEEILKQRMEEKRRLFEEYGIFDDSDVDEEDELDENQPDAEQDATNEENVSEMNDDKPDQISGENVDEEARRQLFEEYGIFDDDDDVTVPVSDVDIADTVHPDQGESNPLHSIPELEEDSGLDADQHIKSSQETSDPKQDEGTLETLSEERSTSGDGNKVPTDVSTYKQQQLTAQDVVLEEAVSTDDSDVDEIMREVGGLDQALEIEASLAEFDTAVDEGDKQASDEENEASGGTVASGPETSQSGKFEDFYPQFHYPTSPFAANAEQGLSYYLEQERSSETSYEGEEESKTKGDSVTTLQSTPSDTVHAKPTEEKGKDVDTEFETAEDEQPPGSETLPGASSVDTRKTQLPAKADARSSGPDTNKTEGASPDLWASGKMGKMGRITRKKGKRITEELKQKLNEYGTEGQADVNAPSAQFEVPSQKHDPRVEVTQQGQEDMPATLASVSKPEDENKDTEENKDTVDKSEDDEESVTQPLLSQPEGSNEDKEKAKLGVESENMPSVSQSRGRNKDTDDRAEGVDESSTQLSVSQSERKDIHDEVEVSNESETVVLALQDAEEKTAIDNRSTTMASALKQKEGSDKGTDVGDESVRLPSALQQETENSNKDDKKETVDEKPSTLSSALQQDDEDKGTEQQSGSVKTSSRSNKETRRERRKKSKESSAEPTISDEPQEQKTVPQRPVRPERKHLQERQSTASKGKTRTKSGREDDEVEERTRGQDNFGPTSGDQFSDEYTGPHKAYMSRADRKRLTNQRKKAERDAKRQEEVLHADAETSDQDSSNTGSHSNLDDKNVFAVEEEEQLNIVDVAVPAIEDESESSGSSRTRQRSVSSSSRDTETTRAVDRTTSRADKEGDSSSGDGKRPRRTRTRSRQRTSHKHETNKPKKGGPKTASRPADTTETKEPGKSDMEKSTKEATLDETAKMNLVLGMGMLTTVLFSVLLLWPEISAWLLLLLSQKHKEQ